MIEPPNEPDGRTRGTRCRARQELGENTLRQNPTREPRGVSSGRPPSERRETSFVFLGEGGREEGGRARVDTRRKNIERWTGGPVWLAASRAAGGEREKRLRWRGGADGWESEPTFRAGNTHQPRPDSDWRVDEQSTHTKHIISNQATSSLHPRVKECHHASRTKLLVQLSPFFHL